MFINTILRPLTLGLALAVLPSLAQAQTAQTAQAQRSIAPPPGPYTALPAVISALPDTRAPVVTAQPQPAIPASQIWARPQGQNLPYWMRAPQPTLQPIMGQVPQAPGRMAQPESQAAAPTIARGNSIGFGQGFMSGFSQGFSPAFGSGPAPWGWGRAWGPGYQAPYAGQNAPDFPAQTSYYPPGGSQGEYGAGPYWPQRAGSNWPQGAMPYWPQRAGPNWAGANAYYPAWGWAGR